MTAAWLIQKSGEPLQNDVPRPAPADLAHELVVIFPASSRAWATAMP